MSTTGRSAGTADAAGIAAAVREAGFVHLVAAADGDSLAAAGLLAGGCAAAGVPFQANVARTDAERRRRLADAGDDLAIAVGAGDGDRSLPGRDAPESPMAYRAALELGADPDPVLALAGAVAPGVVPGGGRTAEILDAAREAGAVERRAGVAIPVADPADGLAHSTRVHAGFSADPEEAAALAADAGFDADAEPDAGAADATAGTRDGDHQALASLVALAAAGDERAVPRSADAVERAVRPYATPEGPFATVGGYADVLAALGRSRPGTGVALALGGDVREAALSAWRDHGTAAHAALRAATTGRYDGLLAARVDGDAPVATVARLLLDWRSPEPAVLVVGGTEAAAVSTLDGVDVGAALRAAVAAVGGSAGGDLGMAYARHEGEPRDVVTAFREAEP